MANLKEVRTRISSTISTQQITKAMKLVSATKLRKAQNAIMQLRPYAEKLQFLLANLSSSADDNDLKVFFKPRPIKNVLIVVLTSDRGLCGPFNANVNKATQTVIKHTYKDLAPKNITLMFMGKKGFEFYKSSDYTLNTDHKEIFGDTSAENIFEVGDIIIQEFKSGILSSL